MQSSILKKAVTGPRGRLGSELVRQGCTPIEANILDYSKLREEIRGINPDVIVHCAAYTDVDGCESSPKHASEVNTCGTYILTEAFSGKIVYISTDYIFDGENGPYDEDAKPNPISIYGWSKLGGEIVLRNRGNPDDLIIRTTVLFDRHSKNFVTNVINQLLTKTTVAVPAGLYGSPTYIPHLAEAILALAALDLGGIINITGDRVVSRHAFTQMISESLGLGTVRYLEGWKPRTPRPTYAGLNIELAKALKLPIHDPMEGVKEIVNALETMAAG